MTTLFSSISGVLLTLLLVAGYAVALRMRDDLAVLVSQRRMSSGGASDGA